MWACTGRLMVERTGPGMCSARLWTVRSGTWSAWRDLTLNPVSNDSLGMNAYGLDISSIFIDPHDPTGNTVYVTVDGVSDDEPAGAGSLSLDRRRGELGFRYFEFALFDCQ